MDRIITTEEYTKALDTVREGFNSMNKDLFDEIAKCEKTGSFMYRQHHHHMEYKDFYDVLKIGFQSLDLHQLFETMAYLYYFKGVVTVSLEMDTYIKFDKFDTTGFFKEVRSTLKILIAVNILEAWVRQALLAFKIKDPDKIFSKPDYLLSCTKAIQYGKERDLHYYGDREFVISKIDFEASDHTFDTKLVAINPNIFYTSNPTQIINFASLAKPGVYIVANIPYGQHQDTAFYVIFRQEKYAYIIENNKHSYRDQIYRTKSDGTSGQDAFLDRKYEQTYFPIQLVLNFIQKQSSSTDVTNPVTLDFIPLGNLYDCCPEIVLWNYAFIDMCAQHFLKEDFTKQITTAACIDFMRPELASMGTNLPAVYTSALPSLASLNLSWSAEKVDVKDHVTGTFLDTLRPDVALEQVPLPSAAKITSLEQIHRELIFNKRKKEAEIMQEAIDRDFIEHFDAVKHYIIELLHKKGTGFIALKSLRGFTYPKTVYPQPKSIMFQEGEVKEYPKVIQVPLLQIFDLKQGILHINSAFWGDRCVFYNDPPFRGGALCDCCRIFPTIHFYVLDFKEYAHFKLFFEITDDSTVPAQLRDFLSQQKTGYLGNSILDDIDPVARVHIPWWKTYLRDGEIMGYRDAKDICLPIRFGLCGKCRNKILKQIALNPGPKGSTI